MSIPCFCRKIRLAGVRFFFKNQRMGFFEFRPFFFRVIMLCDWCLFCNSDRYSSILSVSISSAGKLSIASTSFRSCKLDFSVMDAEAESVRFLPTADLSGCWLPNISLPPLLVHLMNYRFCDNNLIIILACCQEAPPAVFCTCGALWIIADGTPFH